MASFLLFYLYNFHVYMIAKTTVLINYIYMYKINPSFSLCP